MKVGDRILDISNGKTGVISSVRPYVPRHGWDQVIAEYLYVPDDGSSEFIYAQHSEIKKV